MIELWEIVLVVVGIAFVVLCVYLIGFIKKAKDTVEKVDKLIDENKVSIGQILENLKKISDDTEAVSHRAAKVVKGVEKAMGPRVTETGIANSVVRTKNALGVANLSLLGLRFIRTFTKKIKKS